MQRTTYLEGARRAWPLTVAVGGFGLTYGVLARQAGFSAAATIVFSLTTFAGSAQFAAVSIYTAWVVCSIVGVAAGSMLGDPEALGLDAAFPALFLALLAGQVRERRLLLAALAGGAIALAMVPLTPPGVPIVAASVVCLAGLGRGQARA